MTKLTLVSDYHYTQQPRDYTYYVYYKLLEVVYTDTLDIDTRLADRIVDYVITHYNKMMYTMMGDTKPMLIVEDTIEEGTLAEAVVLLKEVARKAMLSAIQENELIQRVCGWAGQGTYQQDPALPLGYEGRTVISYPYTPSLPDNLWHYRVHDIRNTPYTTEVCGIRIVLVTDKRGYPVHTYDFNNSILNFNLILSSNTSLSSNSILSSDSSLDSKSILNSNSFLNSNSIYYSVLGRLGCTTEEASQAMRRLSQAMHAEGQYTQALSSVSHAEGGGIQEAEDNLFTKHKLYSVPTPEGKPVRLAYEDTDTQQHNDTHTHIQQEDTTHVYNIEDTHYYTQTDSVIDTHTLTHNDVVYDTQEIDTYIHSMIDIP